MKAGKINIVMGGQAGSESKGKISAYLVDKFAINRIASNLSPNAGHVVVRDGVKTTTHHIPAGAVGTRLPGSTTVYLGPATLINPSIFRDEVRMVMENTQIPARNILVDDRINMIMPLHTAKEERTMTKIGSTAQGVGECRSDQIMRRGHRAAERPEFWDELGVTLVKDVGEHLRYELKMGRTVLYEMSQGFDLCMLHGVDPVYCTSRICNPQAALAEMGIPSRFLGDVYAVIRPYPIRVNNRDGSSGPYPSTEITWDEVARRAGIKEGLMELTTTTNLPRRVFEFSISQVRRMISICDPTYLCLNFANYIDATAYKVRKVEELPDKVNKFCEALAYEYSLPVAYVGTGPDHYEIVDVGLDGWA